MTKLQMFCTAALALSAGCAHSSQQTTAVPPAPAAEPITIPLDQLKYRKGYPEITPEVDAKTKARQAKWDAHDDAAWARAQPIVAAEAGRGRPYFPVALNPEVLPKAKIPAFPGAEGGGMWTPGGRGGRVYVVTNLNDDGPGSYREALEAGGGRTVVFNVAGVIKLNSPVHIRAPYITIEGQSAPGDGVCIAGYSTKIDTHDVIIRFMRFRRGNTEVSSRDDALGGDSPVGNIIIDHCSASWGTDETMSLYRQMYRPVPGQPAVKLPLVNTTIQWSIITEGLNTYHHAFGATWGGRNSMFAHNLFACNTGRNASIGMNYDFNFVNNVLFNWQHRTLDGGDDSSLLNVINNYYKPGPATNDTPVKYRVVKPERRRGPGTNMPFGRYYVDGNVVEGNDRVTNDNWDGGVQFTATVDANEQNPTTMPADEYRQLIRGMKASKPFPMPQVTVLPAKQNYEAVLATAGATLPVRDAVDERATRQARTGEVDYKQGKGIITDISQVGGYPIYKGKPHADADADGMPDAYEKANGLNPKDAADASAIAADGYSNLEHYLNGLVAQAKK